ncbi:MAG: DinB family protein [Candidatus Limnocylindria bacterium]
MDAQSALFRQKAREYLRTRGTLAAPAVVHDRVGAAFAALGEFLDAVPPDVVARRTIPGEWTIQEIADHLLETHRPGLDELRCLLAGQRPPGPPIPAGLQSKAPMLRPWPWLSGELARVHQDILETLDAVSADFESDARAPLVMVINVPGPAGGFTPEHWIEELDWKAYAVVWRLHALDHLGQAKKVLAAAR